MLIIKDLEKSYGSFKALNGLNLEIKQGQLYGFVGPNGAGKTTTMKIISGLLTADRGQIILDGIDILDNPKYLKQSIGYMPDFFGVYDNLKVIEYMEFFASTYDLNRKSSAKTIESLLHLVGLIEKKNDYVDGLSRGMKQKLCLARTLIHKPKLLILDEPASGMEPRARMEMQDILKKLAVEGTTIIISSHVLPELAEMCTNIGIIDKGKMVISGSMEEVMTMQYKATPILMKLTQGIDVAMKMLKTNPLVTNIAIRDSNISFGFNGNSEKESEILADLIMSGARVSEFRRQESNLETIFLQLTEE
ncbi:ABC transporter ATP-binding protein [Clostridium sp. Marseille-P299]|uniref:ABC transporter ATP-binding protein n=1 Tax=Clostridium sp. Marseille-P299 TaxID=1805477 RepID=UPI000835637D|nr:ABC transporter ATP-binding protein [Clostridium sp. Marseille-P299]